MVQAQGDPTARGEDVIGVVVVTFASADVIVECLESLVASTGVSLKIVVVDNCSPDDTRAVIRDWASGRTPFQRPANSPLPAVEPTPKPLALAVLDEEAIGAPLGPLTLIESPLNRGFAGAVNVGLKALGDQVGLFWVLNPDCAVRPEAARAYAAAARSDANFSLMTGFTAFYDDPEIVQSAGGRVDRFTGVCHQWHVSSRIADLGDLDAQNFDWVTGANLIVSPAFLKAVGPMREHYFLYYEEIDWAFRRGGLPIRFVPDSIVYHHQGTSIGSGSRSRRSSALANYFNHRNRVRFSRRFLRFGAGGAYLYGMAKIIQLAAAGAFEEAFAGLAGLWDLPPPRAIRQRFKDPAAAALAFARDEPG
jgi:GT2 family glycosyltransferase